MMVDPRLSTLMEGLLFGEGPRWHNGRLYLSDIADGKVLAIGDDAALTAVATLSGRPSGIGWLPDGRLLVVSMIDHRLLRLESDGLVFAGDISHLCGGHANDMVVDSSGRAYISNVGFQLDGVSFEELDIRATNLVRVDPDGSVHCAATEMMSPNGMALSEDERLLIVAESAAACLTAFDVDAHGNLSGRRVFATLEGGAVPDGICLDAEGAVWMASPMTCEFLRVQEGGAVLDRIATGDRVAIACVLGGDDRKTLYCVTNSSMVIDEEVSCPEGRIEIAQVDVPGAGTP